MFKNSKTNTHIVFTIISAFIFLINNAYAQKDTLKNTTNKPSAWNPSGVESPAPKEYNTIHTIKYFYDNQENVKIVKDKKGYKKIEYYDTGEKKSESRIIFILAIDSAYNPSPQFKDSIAFLEVHYKLDFIPIGKYTEWFKDGKVSVIGYYKNGNKAKEWHYYNEKGEQIKATTW